MSLLVPAVLLPARLCTSSEREAPIPSPKTSMAKRRFGLAHLVANNDVKQ